MKAETLCSICSMFVGVMALSIAPLELSARTLGMVADRETNSVTVFDADTHAVLGTVPITPGPTTGDVLITPDMKRGFVTNLDFKVFGVDLTTSPPSLAAGINPIPISSPGLDLSISPDGKFLVVVGGFFAADPISVIDITTRTEISTFFTGFNLNSLDVCSDGSVLVGSLDSGTVRRLTLSGAGTLTDTGEVLSVSDAPMNVSCAPDAKSGVVIQNASDIGVTSFTIPGLSEVDTRPLSVSAGTGISVAINPSGNRVFALSAGQGEESIKVFDFNSATGALGASPLLTFSLSGTSGGFIGIDQIALHPNGGKLFVSEPRAVNIYNPSTGALLASITDPAIVTPTGVTVVTEADPCALPPPAGAIVGTNGPNQINGTSGNDVIFGLGGPDTINGRGGNDLICGGAGSDLITGGAGDDVLNTQDGVSGNDSVNGGPGNDTCTGDPGDALSSCNP